MADSAAPEQKSGLVSNILGIIGFIILIVILIWGLFHLAVLSSDWFASMFGSKKTAGIEITIPSSVPSDTPVTINWKYDPKEAGSFAFIYQCQKDVMFKAKGLNNTTNGVPCGTSYMLPSTEKSLTVTPMSKATSSLSVPFVIAFMPAAATSTRVQGSATLLVTPKQSVATSTPPTSTPNTPGSNNGGQPTNPPVVTGPADLWVRIISSGVIDPVTGVIVPRRPTSDADLVAVTFDIANNGGSASGSWYFTANLPTVPSYLYTSEAQISLAPGEHIENTLRFTKAIGGGVFSVSVDPTNTVKESNEGNNWANVNI